MNDVHAQVVVREGGAAVYDEGAAAVLDHQAVHADLPQAS
jgi:hypothetical protein